MTTATHPPAWSACLVNTLRRPMGQQDRQRAALHLIDWLGCAHLGQTSPTGEVLKRWAKHQVPGPIWACGHHHGLSASDAARWNGSLGNCHELDDVHRAAVVHPGDTVIPAALAMAQREGVSGKRLLEALVIGYETGILLGLLSGPSHYAQWYSTATTGVFASAMACAHLRRLDPLQTQHALALAGMQSSGVWQCRLEPGLAKQLATVHSAQAGLLAADMAAAGMTGPLAILEGPLGWLAATAGQRDAGQAMALLQSSADSAWRMHEVSFKPWPACRHVHPAIECALHLHAQGLEPAQIEQLQLHTYAVALTFADQPAPQTPLEGKFSLQHGVAWALCHGSFGLEATAQSALTEPACSLLRARVQVVCGPDQERAYPGQFGARLQARMKNGSLWTHGVASVLGDPENPLSPAQIHAKSRGLLQGLGWSPERAQGLVSACLQLPQGLALKHWWPLLEQAA